MTDAAVRCGGCGVLNSNELTACRTCGTLLPTAARRGASEPSAPPPTEPQPGAASPPPSQLSADGRLGRVAGVGRLFVALLGLWIAEQIAAALGIPEVSIDLATTTSFAGIAVGCAIVARAEVVPLLVRTGGWRAAGLALAGFGLLVAFGSLYFPALRWLGFSFLRMTPQYLETGWPRLAPYLFGAAAPALFEELTFRGYVMARLDLILTPRETLLVQAALFSLLHLGVAIFPSHFVIGLVLGLLRRRTRSLYPGMAVHLTWNAAVIWAELSGRNFL